MSEEEYLEKLVNDFGENQDYKNNKKKKF